jgi:hypothetical protein
MHALRLALVSSVSRKFKFRAFLQDIGLVSIEDASAETLATPPICKLGLGTKSN